MLHVVVANPGFNPPKNMTLLSLSFVIKITSLQQFTFFDFPERKTALNEHQQKLNPVPKP